MFGTVKTAMECVKNCRRLICLGRNSTEHDALRSAGAVRRGVRYCGGVALVRDNAFGSVRTLCGGACRSLHGRRDDSPRGSLNHLDIPGVTESDPIVMMDRLGLTIRLRHLIVSKITPYLAFA